MSDYEHHKGKLVPLNLTIDQFIEERGIVTDDIEEYFEENFDGYTLNGNTNEHLMIVRGYVYKVENVKLDVTFDLFEAKKNANGSIDYHVMFYNGGCGFSEAIDDAIDKGYATKFCFHQGNKNG